jgi:hypothetical protein
MFFVDILPSSFQEMVYMLNIQTFMDSLELALEIQGLKDLGLTDEEIEGFIDMFCNEIVSARADEISN